MKIRGKLLILLLVSMLVPLLISALVHRTSMGDLGRQLARDTREALTENAILQLQILVESYSRTLHLEKEALGFAVQVQARKIEQRLASPPPPSFPEVLPGNLESGKVSLQATAVPQACFVVQGVSGNALRGDLARLAALPKDYRQIQQFKPDLVSWQFTALETGFETCYPGRGDYPPDYDPRSATWYQKTRKAGAVTWSVMPDLSTKELKLVVAAPLTRPDASFAGVTGIAVSFPSLFRKLQLPKQWATETETILLFLQEDSSEGKLKVEIEVHHHTFANGDARPEDEFEYYLGSEEPEEMAALLGDAQIDKAGVRLMLHEGEKALWAYGAYTKDQPFPVVIVPYQQIITKASQAELQVKNQTAKGLMQTGLIMIGFMAVMVGLAFWGSRSVSQPVKRLTKTAELFSVGDFAGRVQINTGDELQELGETFNAMGSRLQEHQYMKQALALAVEVQQHLLPQQAPQLQGFDIYGQSLYCDETGGDYFDFIEMVDGTNGKLGLAVGDVTGHGIGSAMLMAGARGVLRSYATHYHSDLTQLFRELNHHLVRDTGDALFMTLFYGVLDSKTRSLHWVSGGHGPALLFKKKDAAFEQLLSTGIPLGILEDVPFEPAAPIPLQSGDVILIGTDGIWETRNPAGDLFGFQRLQEVLLSCPDKPAQEIFNRVMEEISAFRADGRTDDDITLVVVKVQ